MTDFPALLLALRRCHDGRCPDCRRLLTAALEILLRAADRPTCAELAAAEAELRRQGQPRPEDRAAWN